MNKTLLFAGLVLVASQAWADKRPEYEMQNIASATLLGNVAQVKGLRPVVNELECVRKEENYHIYTLNNEAFVVVSTDDASMPVLGYSMTRYDEANLPCGLRWWLDAVAQTDPKALKAPSSKVASVEPFIKTSWNQDEPYNNLIPEINGKRPPVGCVATSMSQVINYWQYPASAKFYGRYVLGGTPGSEQINSTYSFPYLEAYGSYIGLDKETHSIDYTDEQATAIATLCRDCGYAVDMDYALSGSGAFTSEAGSAMIEKFHYPKSSLKYYLRELYSADEWYDIVAAELNAGSPILYGASDTRYGGHSFVLGGINPDGLIYVNWGWAGNSNGFYNLHSLIPRGYNFDIGVEMVTGVRPEPLPTDREVYQFNSFQSYNFVSSIGEVVLNLSGGAYNGCLFPCKGAITVIFENKETGEIKTKSIYESSFNYGYGIGGQLYNLPSNSFTNGEYKAYVAFQSSETGEIVPVRTPDGYIYYDATVSGKRGNINFTFGDEAHQLETAISAPVIADAPSMSGVAYSISGQAVNLDTYKGIVILNGKKYYRR